MLAMGFASDTPPAPSMGDRQYHLDVGPGDVEENLLLVGDPDRAARVAARFDAVRFQHHHREYHVHTGTHRGLPMTVVCVGMGAGSMEIAVVELMQLLATPTFVRCGSTGALQPELRLGDLVVSTGAVRMESASLGYVEPGYPAVAHAEVVMALTQAAAQSGRRFHTGLGATASGFYGPQGREAAGLLPLDPGVVDRLERQGVLNMEMETSCLLTLASRKRLRAGAVCAVYAQRTEGSFANADERAAADSACIEVALEGLHILARMREQSGGRPWHPGLAVRD